jgi:hypothetical protein
MTKTNEKNTCPASENNSVVSDVLGDVHSLVEKDQDLSRARTPDFFICGAAKAGTTSLFNYLGQHPSIFTPSVKEPGYFSALRTFLQEPAEYDSLFGDVEESRVTGEASTAYLTSPDSAHRIASAAPDARIIIMLRNPADRAFSHYRWMTREGWEYASSFREALRLEREHRSGNRHFVKQNPEYYYNYLYFKTGFYSCYLNRYLNFFSNDQIHFILFEEFVEAPVYHSKEVYRFLGVDDSFTPQIKVHNRGRDVWSPRFQYFVRQSLRPTLDALSFPSRVRICSQLLDLNKGKSKAAIDPALRQKLLECYREDIRRTEVLVDMPLQEAWL